MRVLASWAIAVAPRHATPEIPGRRRTSPDQTAGRALRAEASRSVASRRRRRRASGRTGRPRSLRHIGPCRVRENGGGHGAADVDVQTGVMTVVVDRGEAGDPGCTPQTSDRACAHAADAIHHSRACRPERVARPTEIICQSVASATRPIARRRGPAAPVIRRSPAAAVVAVATPRAPAAWRQTSAPPRRDDCASRC